MVRKHTSSAADDYIRPKDAKKERVPSYCDRILHRSMPHLEGRLVRTACFPVRAVTTSDHKPLAATFELRPPRLPTPRIEVATLCVTGVAVRGAFPLLPPNTSRVKLRFFTSPPGLLIASRAAHRAKSANKSRAAAARAAAPRAPHAGPKSAPPTRRSLKSERGHANVRTSKVSVDERLESSPGGVPTEQTLRWDDSELPHLLPI